MSSSLPRVAARRASARTILLHCAPLAAALLFVTSKPAEVCASDIGGTWQSVYCSGAQCLVTGVITHPSGTICIRTDVGAAFKWNRSTSTWSPLTDFLTFNQRTLYFCEALAIDPSNANTMYYAGGSPVGTDNSQVVPGAIFKSTNGGSSWSQTGLSNVVMQGNGDRRWGGERLQVDPANSSVILFGSREQGLYRSADGGNTWSTISSIPVAGDSYGVQSVVFDPAANGIVYAAVSGYGVYQSTDHGVTFASIGGNTSPRRMAVSTSGSLWYTNGSNISKWRAGTWYTWTPNGTTVYCGLAVNPSNSNEILIGSTEPFSGSEKIYRTTDTGTTWTQLTISQSSTAPWFSNWGSMWTSSLAYDPLNTSTVWCNEWQTTNIAASTVAWLQQEAGHEEDCLNALISPPSGTYELVSCSSDDDGFAFASNSLTVCPAHTLGVVGTWTGDSWDVCYERTNPQNMLRLTGQNWNGGNGLNVCRSANGGATWNRLNNFSTNHMPMVSAYSATNSNNMVIICSSNHSSDPTGQSWPSSLTDSTPWQYTTDGGNTWQTCSGLPTPPAYHGGSGALYKHLTADGSNGATFYDFENSSGPAIYVSTNSGQSFSKVNATGLPGSWFSFWEFKARPDVAGDLWLSVDRDNPNFVEQSHDPTTEGLYHSSDGGVTWTKLANVQRAWVFGFGKPVNNGGPAALYLFGLANGETAMTIYESADLGNSWIQIQSPTNALGDTPMEIAGSWQTTGRVFVGTSGRGIFFGQGVTNWYEAETLSVAAQTSGISYRLSNDPGFSNDTGSYFDATAANQYVTLDVPNIPIATYDIRVGMKTWNNKGQWQLAISRMDQQGSPTNLGSPVDMYSANQVFTEVDLGTWTPGTASDKAFRFMVVGKNASSTGYGIDIDYIHLVPQ